jgi:lysophospholipase L1-like esterase
LAILLVLRQAYELRGLLLNLFYIRRFLLLALASTLLYATQLPAAAKGVESYDAPLERFEGAVKTFESHDHGAMPAPGGTVFVGSSTFAHWTTMEADLKDLKAINHGFGGSTLPEVNHYFDRLVTRYKPDRIVLYAGTNDIADGHSAERVARDFAAFLAQAHTALPAAQVYFISMSMPPCRVQFAKQYNEGNRLILQMATQDPHLHYIDVTRVMFDDRGILHKDYFGPDRLHMNRTGYEAWMPVIRSALKDTGATRH